MTLDKNKLATEIERSVHKHVKTVNESVIDFTHLYIRRNNINVDRPTLAAVLDIVSKGIQSEHLNKLDTFMKNINEVLKANNED